jgi:RHS repeat-associated protein
MIIKSRSWTDPTRDYRFGFNGKENDDEVKGEGNQQDYGLRIYDSRLGRFLSVDPLTKEYPWYTPYQFAGNDVIRNIDLDGAEPHNPQSKPEVIGSNPFTANRFIVSGSLWTHYHGEIALQLFALSGGSPQYERHTIGGTEQQAGSLTQTNLFSLRTFPSGLEHNEYVNNTYSVFKVSDHTNGNGIAFSNWMLGNFILGQGPETYEFGEKNKLSIAAFETKIFSDALAKYKEAGMPEYFHTKSGYGFLNQAGGLIKDKSVFTLENFIGSADVFFKKVSANEIRIQIINVTSLTSADYSKHIPGHGAWPKSTVIGTGSFYKYPIPFRNVAQVFNKTMYINK